MGITHHFRKLLAKILVISSGVKFSSKTIQKWLAVVPFYKNGSVCYCTSRESACQATLTTLNWPKKQMKNTWHFVTSTKIFPAQEFSVQNTEKDSVWSHQS